MRRWTLGLVVLVVVSASVPVLSQVSGGVYEVPWPSMAAQDRITRDFRLELLEVTRVEVGPSFKQTFIKLKYVNIRNEPQSFKINSIEMIDGEGRSSTGGNYYQAQKVGPGGCSYIGWRADWMPSPPIVKVVVTVAYQPRPFDEFVTTKVDFHQVEITLDRQDGFRGYRFMSPRCD